MGISYGKRPTDPIPTHVAPPGQDRPRLIDTDFSPTEVLAAVARSKNVATNLLTGEPATLRELQAMPINQQFIMSGGLTPLFAPSYLDLALSCDYCGTDTIGPRCLNCGAPRRTHR